MKVCILAPAAHVDAIRQTARENGFTHAHILASPASPNGKGPASHWYCVLGVTQADHDRLLGLRNLSEMVVIEDVREFLKSKGLRPIKGG